MAAIQLGRTQRYRFVSEGPLSSWTPQRDEGVFAITYKKDPQAKPKAHTVIYFGQSAKLSSQAPAIKRDAHDWWVSHGGTVDELTVFVYEMPASTTLERDRVQSQLIAEYDPQANN